MHLNSVLLCLSLLCSRAAMATDTLKVLFIGNSMTYVQDLPGMLQSIASGAGKVVITAESAPGGFHLTDHVNYAPTINLLNQQWDYVVLQEQSLGLIQPAVPGSFVTPLEVLDTLIRKNCGRSLFYVTPGYPNPFQSPLDSNYFAMQSRLIERYRVASESVRGALLPTGHAWRAVVRDYPQINTGLWASSSDYHPGVKGQYLNACVLFSVLFNQSAVGLPLPPGISLDEGAILQQVAWNEVKDSAWVFGYNHLNMLRADFSLRSDSLTITLIDSSSGMSNRKQIDWGDGYVTTVTPIVFQDYNRTTHSYTEAGNYLIRQNVWWSNCDSTYAELLVNIPLNTQKTEKNQPEIFVHPNPSKGMFEITSTNSQLFNNATVRVYSIAGILLCEWNYSNNKINLESLPAGIYILEIQSQDFKATQKLIKQ